MLHVGQKVVCVDIRPVERALRPGYAGTVIPTLGGVYTIRYIFDAGVYGYDEPGLLLCEIVNPVRKYISPAGRPVTCEAFWWSFRFRPVRTTNIDVFEKLLEPKPARVELVTAD